MLTKNIFSPTLFLLLVLVLSTFLLSGCTDKEQTDDYGNIMLEDDANIEAGENVSDPVLAAGQILLIRLVYNIIEDDDDDNEWYKVSLSRVGKKWSDSVKIQGIIRTKTRHYDDYTFGSNNFNWQITQEQYGIDTLNGDYEISIEGSNGYLSTHRLHWADGKWTNASPVLTFSVR